MTLLERQGEPIAALVHDESVRHDPELIEAVAAAARLALTNERLQAEVRAQLEEVRASRARIVEAGDRERRRVERNIHDGAQQQLVALMVKLRLTGCLAGARPGEGPRDARADARRHERRARGPSRPGPWNLSPAPRGPGPGRRARGPGPEVVSL